MNAHSLAVVHPAACVGRDVRIGPFCVVEEDVTIGDGCILESHVVVKKGTTLGEGNHVFSGAVLGDLPQHIHVPEHPGRLTIGSGNVIREHVTMHRSLHEGELTLVGDDSLFMVNAHIAHDCRVGNQCIFANNVMIAGHVVIEDRAYISGAAGAHQFCRIGSLAMVGGQAHVNKDIPPFVTVDGLSSLVVGLNQIGLRRAGYRAEEIRQLKAAYRVIYRSGLAWNEVLKRLQSEFTEGPAARYYPFLSTTTRGIVGERRVPPGATLKLREEAAQEAAAETLPIRAKVV